MPALNAVSVYNIPNTNCRNFNYKIDPTLKNLSFIYFSKRGEFQPKKQEIVSYINNSVLSCMKFDGQEIRVDELIKVKNIYTQISETEIDLSNKTRNGTNSIYFQLYQIKMKKGDGQ